MPKKTVIVKTYTVSKFDLINAFADGKSLMSANLLIVHAVEREDANNKNYNVTGYDVDGKLTTVFCKTN